MEAFEKLGANGELVHLEVTPLLPAKPPGFAPIMTRNLFR